MKKCLSTLLVVFHFVNLFSQSQAASQTSAIKDSKEKIESILRQAMEIKTIDPEQSLQLSRQAFSLSKSDGYEQGICKSLNRIGSAWLAKGELDSAKFYFQSALSESKKRKLPDHHALALINVGHYHHSSGNYDSAFYYFHTALQWGEVFQNAPVTVKSLISLGEISRTQNNLKDARHYLQKAIRISAQSNDDENLAFANQNLGIVMDQLDLPDSSLYYSGKALDYFKTHGQLKGTADCLLNMGVVLEWAGEEDSALTYYQNAKNLFTKLEDIRGIATSTLNSAGLKFNRGEYQTALTEAQFVIQLAKGKGMLPLEMLAYSNIHEWHAASGRYTDAYSVLQKADSIHQIIQSAEKTKVIQNLQTKYETVQKEKLISEQEQIITQKEWRNKLIILIGLLAIGLALIVILIFRIRIANARKDALLKSQKVEELLNDQEIKTYNALLDGQENERRRIAMELHDRLGNLLITAQLQLKSPPEKDPSQKKKDTQASETLIEEAINEVRRISRNLNSGSIDNFGLGTAIQELTFNIASSNLFECTFHCNCLANRFNSSIEITYYRIAQEIVTNAIKYSQAKRIDVQLNLENAILSLTIEDDGIGFDTKASVKGLGIDNIQKRANTIKAILTFDSKLGCGTMFHIECPVDSFSAQ